MRHQIGRRVLALFGLLLAASGGLGAATYAGITPGSIAPTSAEASALASAGSTPPAFAARAAVASGEAVAPSVRAEAAPGFSGDEARRHVDALAGRIGSRVAGSESQLRAAEYLADQFRRLGYQTELQPFEVTFYDDRGATLTVGGAGGQAVDARTLQYAHSVAIDGELVDGGLGRPSELAAANVGGKIALIERGEIRFNEKVANAARAGALGVVIFNNQPGAFSGSLIDPATIPAVSVSQADGAALLDRLGGEPVIARLAVDAALERRTAQNVVATRAGGPETIVIGAHYDSVPAGPGANDNGSGTAVVLELARVMATTPTPFTLKLALFDAEEIGLLGSAHLVSQLSADELRAIRAMINVDMVGVGDAFQLGGDDSLVQIGQGIANQLGQRAGNIGDATGGSDHASFARAGVPALFLYCSNDPNYHSPNDRAEYVDPDNLLFAGRVAFGVLDALGSGR